MAEVKTEQKTMPPLLGGGSYIPPTNRRTSQRRRGWLIALIVLILVALAGGGLAYWLGTRPPTIQYTQQPVTRGNLTLSVSATGPITPANEVNVGFTATGQVNAIDVHIGQQVKAGQTLATLNATLLQDQVAEAQQKLSAAQQAYNDAQYYGATQTVLDQDNQNVQAAQLALKTAQDTLAGTTLTSPINGTVAAINGSVGENMGAGSGNNGQTFITITDTSSFSIAALVNEADIAQVKTGQDATFTVAAYPARTFHATVHDIQTVGQTISNVVNYTVDLAVTMSSINGASIYPGMTATVTIITAHRTNVLLVPNTALSFTSLALEANEINRNALTSLFTNGNSGNTPKQQAGKVGKTAKTGKNGHVNKGNGTAAKRGVVLELQNGKLTPVLLTTGLTDGQNTEVLSGLSAGTQVVVSQTGGKLPTSTLLPATNPLKGVNKGHAAKKK